MADKACVLVLASGASWESEALSQLAAAREVVVLKRCVDTEDLLATAATGQAEVAVVSVESPGFDTGAVEHLRRHDVLVVAIAADPTREDLVTRLPGVRAVVGATDLSQLPVVIRRVRAEARAYPADAGAAVPGAGSHPREPGADAGHEDGRLDGPGEHKVVVVWGPAGAPGRTTLASALAAELATRGVETLLVDADPHAPSVAQQLGLLDQLSGVLAATRNAGVSVLADRLERAARRVGPGLTVLTGLPRPDRWVEVRPGALGLVLENARESWEVVVDAGFDLGGEVCAEAGGAARNGMTLEALAAADEVLVVGSADPVGLSRLVRGLVELREVVPQTPVRVVVNRMRGSLGWSTAEVAGMVDGFAEVCGLHFLPYDRAGTDRSLVAGRAVGEAGDCALARAIGEVVDAVYPATFAAGAAGQRRGLAGRFRRRTAGTAPRP